MKKLFYILALSLVTSLSITSCTEEEVKPQTDLANGGGKGVGEGVGDGDGMSK